MIPWYLHHCKKTFYQVIVVKARPRATFSVFECVLFTPRLATEICCVTLLNGALLQPDYVLFCLLGTLPHLLKSIMMSAFSVVTSLNLKGVTSPHTPNASMKTRRTLSSLICQGKRTILLDTHRHTKSKIKKQCLTF